VAGTIGAATNNGTGVAGDQLGQQDPAAACARQMQGGYTSDIIDAIRWAAGISVPNVPANAFPARVMNLSWWLRV
jgi:serine protease